ncbi:hypothetical protein KR767_20930 [Luteibacter anthropi]|uniref:hypothetical protein n=1 Tax=Luteibacter anthropi TaxID=564369 RepID=UPI00203251DA|nr:hypothetical protein [Luteibacter anthropi]URX62465.1 hypothetical protein KR767_20930 [Luteibacter anthropi]
MAGIIVNGQVEQVARVFLFLAFWRMFPADVARHSIYSVDKDSGFVTQLPLPQAIPMDRNEAYLRGLQPAMAEERLRVAMDVDPIVDVITDRYPFSGSTIDWDKVPGSIILDMRHATRVEVLNTFEPWFREQVEVRGLRGTVCVIGDDAGSATILGDMEAVVEYAKRLVDLPQHTYIHDYPHADWMFSLVMSGWMAFGYSPWLRSRRMERVG